MNQLITLSIPMNYGGVEQTIHPSLIVTTEHIILVDCGYIGALPLLEQSMETHNISCGQVTHLVLTHHDHDHMGAAFALKQKYPHIKILAHELESPYISGRKKSLRLIQAVALQETLPKEKQAFGDAFSSMLRRVKPVDVDIEIKTETLYPWGGGCNILFTPGHTPGHISLYLPHFETLIAGDTIALENGKPVLANPQFALDVNLAKLSMEKLLSYANVKILCYHGGIYKT